MCILYRLYVLFLPLKQTINKIKGEGLKGLQEEEIQEGLKTKSRENKITK
jgi:hypothetical protein